MFIAPSKLRHPFALTTSLLCVMILLVLCSCGTPHKTYNYENFTKNLSGTGTQAGEEFYTFNSGASFSLKWTSLAASDSTESSASPVSIYADLRGPYATMDAMKKAMTPQGVTGTIVKSMPVIQTDDWTNKTYQYDFQLDKNLKAGFYILSQKVNSAHATLTYNSEIRIGA
ncbi:hypothetical protein [Dictyobacter arantiisoli]|uniref:Lipoprotein n=1 Tax=Dictyobacter arantiisoli TaxID=2014874 RepID=A0A5A5TD92_9CHLR|nr:hypothetical protein [Dictyobacter arantiisoli]GCF09317.1 hypothetical protein KDI_28810 [Dictyobacter arantiisoli]